MSERGFTLIEALIAFTILAVVVGVTAQAIGSGLSLTGRAAEAELRLDRARTILASVGIDGPLEVGETGGAFADGAAWRLNVTETAAGTPALYRADLTIFDDARPALTLSIMRLGG